MTRSPKRTDANGTCHEHGCSWCIVCVTDELFDAHYEWVERKRQIKREWRETPIHERYDLGGEA